jgi:3-oxoacyl-[acyl-carrier protein] reductase
MDLGIAGKKALIRGGSRGLGKAVALQLAREGARVHLAARDARSLDAAASEIFAAAGVSGWSVSSPASRATSWRAT